MPQGSGRLATTHFGGRSSRLAPSVYLDQGGIEPGTNFGKEHESLVDGVRGGRKTGTRENHAVECGL